MADNKKKFTLQAYDIENEEIGKAYIIRKSKCSRVSK